MRRRFVGDHVGASGTDVSSPHRFPRRPPRQIHREVMPLSRDAPRIGGYIVERTKTLIAKYCICGDLYVTFWYGEVN